MTPGATPILAIDTAGPRLGLGLLVTPELGDVHTEDLGTGHAEVIFLRIKTLLARHRLAARDIARFAVTTGPGSFTGLRIGIAAARGLALAGARPVIGLPSLLAASLSESGSDFVLARDARRGEAFVQAFAAPGAPAGDVRLAAHAEIPPGARVPAPPDMLALARFALGCDPSQWPALPLYVRAADAKPQDGKRVARQ